MSFFNVDYSPVRSCDSASQLSGSFSGRMQRPRLYSFVFRGCETMVVCGRQLPRYFRCTLQPSEFTSGSLLWMNGSSKTGLPLVSNFPQRRSCLFVVVRNQGRRWVLSEFTENFLGARRNRAISFAATAWTTFLGVWSDGRHAICPLRSTLVPVHFAVTMLDAF